jgi:hypothetical protein
MKARFIIAVVMSTISSAAARADVFDFTYIATITSSHPNTNGQLLTGNLILTATSFGPGTGEDFITSVTGTVTGPLYTGGSFTNTTFSLTTSNVHNGVDNYIYGVWSTIPNLQGGLAFEGENVVTEIFGYWDGERENIDQNYYGIVDTHTTDNALEASYNWVYGVNFDYFSLTEVTNGGASAPGPTPGTGLLSLAVLILAGVWTKARGFLAR